MKNKIAPVLFLLAVLASCKKTELPPDDLGNPVFSSVFTAGTASNSLTAGQDGYYMFADFTTDSNGYLIYRGKLASTLDSSAPSIAFEFRNLVPDSPSNIPIDSILHTGSFAFSKPSTATNDIFTGIFTATNPSAGTNYNWQIGDNGPTFTDIAPFVEFIPAPGAPTLVSLTKSYGNKASFTFSQPINPYLPDTSLIGVKMEASYLQPDSSIYLSLYTDTAHVYHYLWSTGSLETFINVDIGDYAVTITTDSGHTATIEASIHEIPFQSTWSSSAFAYELSLQPGNIDPQPGAIALVYTDKNGHSWRSDRGTQPPTSTFFVENSAAYEVNENGYKTQKVQVVYQCLLFDESGLSIPVSGNATVAVAHPD